MADIASLIKESVDVGTGHYFVGPAEVELLTSKVGQTVLVEITVFSDTPDATPVLGCYSGHLLSYYLNGAKDRLADKRDKGKFFFADGTIVYFNRFLLG